MAFSLVKALRFWWLLHEISDEKKCYQIETYLNEWCSNFNNTSTCSQVVAV